MLKKSTLFWLKIVEMCMSLTSFIMYAVYAEGVYDAIYNHGFSHRKLMAIMNIIGIAVTGYTFIIIPTLLVGYAIHKTLMDKLMLIMNIIMTTAGFIAYLVGGAFILNGAVEVPNNGGVTGTGGKPGRSGQTRKVRANQEGQGKPGRSSNLAFKIK